MCVVIHVTVCSTLYLYLFVFIYLFYCSLFLPTRIIIIVFHIWKGHISAEVHVSYNINISLYLSANHFLLLFVFSNIHLCLIIVPCSKSVKKEKYKDSKPKLPSPIKIDDDDDTNMSIRPWLSADGKNKGSKASNSRSSGDDHAATLIVCPLSVLSNWTVSIPPFHFGFLPTSLSSQRMWSL